MDFLLGELKELITKETGASTKSFIERYPTGIKFFDYKNTTLDPKRTIPRLGINAGSLTMAIGKSGSGKTSILIQMAADIVRNIPNALIIHLDYEHATDPDRIMALAGFTLEEYENKYLLLNSGISSESLYAIAKSSSKKKLAHKNELMYDTGEVDEKGKPVMEYPPTIIIVDSVAAMMSKDINEEEEMGGQMSTTAQAKTNNQIIKRLVGSSTLEKANIMIFAVNHITKKIDIGLVKEAADINYLKQGESMPGGTSFPYLSNLLFRINPKTKLDPEGSSTQNKFGIKGFINEIELVKSRTAPAGTKFELIFSQVDGYLSDLTDLKNLVEAKLVSGSPQGGFYIEGQETVKFKNKNFREVYGSNPEFAKAFDAKVDEFYMTMVPKTTNYIQEETITKDGITYKLIDEEQDIWFGNGVYVDSKFKVVEVEFE